MTTVYEKSSLNDHELESAIELMSNEHPVSVRDTPLKMKELLFSELDINIDLSRLRSFFGLIKKIKAYG